MLWHRTAHSGARRRFFSDRPARVCPAACSVLIAGAAGAATGSTVHLLLPHAAPFLSGVAAVTVMFAVVFYEVHRRRWVDPVSLTKTVYILGVLILGGLFGGRAWLGLEPLPAGETGEGIGTLGLIAIALGVPLLLILPAVLAAGDRAPPPDESRLDGAPRL